MHALSTTLSLLLLLSGNVALNLNADSDSVTVTSGDLEAVKKQAGMRANFISEVEELKGAVHISEAELSKLKASTFDPLADVVKRANEASKTMSVQDAINKAGRRLSGEMGDLMREHGVVGESAGFLQTAKRAEDGLLEAAPTLGAGTPIEKALRFLNAEYKEVYEKLDIILFNCGMYKVEKEGLVADINKDIAQLATDCGEYVAAIQHSQMIIDQQNVLLAQLNADLEAHLTSCAQQLAILDAQIAIVVDDLNVVKTIISAGEEACKATMLMQGSGEADFTVRACAGADGKMQFVTESSVLNRALADLKTPRAKEAARRMLWEAMDLDSDDPALAGLGELPSGDLEYSEEGEEEDDDGSDDGNDNLGAFVQVSDDGEAAPFTADDALLLDGDEGEDTAQKEREEQDRAEKEEKEQMAAIRHKKKKKNQKLVAVKKVEQPAQKAGKVKTKPSSKAQKSMCPVGTKPNCAPLMEKLGRMAAEIKEALDKLMDQRAALVAECNRISASFRADIALAEQTISRFTAKMTEDTALLQNTMYEGIQKETERREVCSEMRVEYSKCYKQIKALEEELCGIIVIRYATHQKMVPKIKDPVFQDCIVSGWTPGECSKTCLDQQGIGGVEVFTREVTIAPNKIGAACPPMTFERACGEGYCPLDCEVDIWGAWGKCTKNCGGGSMARTRAITQEPTEGGKPCEETQQGTQCNTHSCDVDCVLHDWTAWAPCTKSCRAYRWSAAGVHSRKRHIRVAIKGNGKCPRPSQRARYEIGRCNNFICPKHLNCIAKLDLIISIDGSGSLWYRSWRRSLWGKNFDRSRKFTETFVTSATLDGYDAQDQDDAVNEAKPELGTKYPKHMRIGVNLFSTRTKEVVPLTGDKKKLLAAIKGMKWPMGATYTHKALLQAYTMLKFSRANRIKTILLITDGRATDVRSMLTVSRKIRQKGITIKVVPVGRYVPRWMVCRTASPPCSQNVEMARRWRVLDYQMKKFVAGTCPQVAFMPSFGE